MDYQSYIGKKGYSILKSKLTVDQQKMIRDDLNVKPYVPGSPINVTESYPVYLESPKKLYLPRFYGIEKFGMPNDNKLPNGEEININFKGMPRDYQIKIVDEFFKHINEKLLPGGLLDIPCGFGKTILALYIIAKLKLKTLVIVHKEFLLNQWIEKIHEFLPDTKIGKIQGQIIDIEDKDIVIGMLQSLSMKEYPEDTFDSFGLTIIDECHHISAEIFVRSLQKIITKYILGLSATMERKDGLTKVFKMFIGDIIYKMKRDKDEGVLIKAIKFVSQDEEFNTIEYDFRGNVKYSTMISKLCSFNNRTEMIISVIENELKLNNKQQIIVLGQFKNILTYLYKAIEHRNIGTVGYYIGGMKEEQLKKSELKQIIIATYSMAAEGLDIKTLTTLILATPKTDIEQAVGRILREKHEQPLVIDIVDNHEVFKKQWDKRKTYYLKNNYKILYTKDFIKNNYSDDGIWCEIKKEKKSSTKEKKCLVNFTNLNIN